MFVAVTEKVYAWPKVKPLTTTGLDAPVLVILPGEEVMVYVLIDAFPVAPAVKVIEALLPASVAVPIVGAAGAEKTNELLAEEAVDVPFAFVAVTV